MAVQRLDHAPLHDFGTWVPLLRLLRRHGEGRNADTDWYASGRIGAAEWSLRLEDPAAAYESGAAGPVCEAVAAAGVEGVTFSVRFTPSGPATLRVMGLERPDAPSPGMLLLVEGAVPEPWRRLPDPAPDAVPAPTADPELLARTIKERMPAAEGASDVQIADAEARLGVPLPDELKALYRVADLKLHSDSDAGRREALRYEEAVRWEPYPLASCHIADATTRPAPWDHAALEAVGADPDARVQGLVGSPGWIVFGENGGGDRLAVDLTPGPRGHVGQIILIGHEEYVGAELLADSLTDLLFGRGREEERREPEARRAAVAHVNIHATPSVEAAAHPGLEVLSIGVLDGEPVSLAPAVGLPRLRTLSASPGTLADPCEIARLTGLEFLSLGPREWRVLLDADAVPRGLSAAAIDTHGLPETTPVPVALANEILALWHRPPIVRTLLKGDLGPADRHHG
ncbi:SMI1/KNR4 family protein [Streptomyces xanthii]|uniref:SMI1/KNR4 family protein n=1 Tax=Streptomyces xanthii TaxID=2768069 RepID=A0A7H1BGJ6_9ACTN|nr:SMI1/KNR4 family protein [Streptomyces xanthii]QNS07851.1 SMI1/KNR4 family protein [Streptomyces xanthii]